MAIIKGVAKYAVILVALALGAVLVLGAVMILFNVPIFGFRFVNMSEDFIYQMDITTQNTDTTIEKFDKIEIIADRFAVEVVATPLAKVLVNGKIHLNGFYKVDEDSKEQKVTDLFTIHKPVTTGYKAATGNTREQLGTLVVEAKMPEGLLNVVANKITIAVPKGYQNLVSIVSTTGTGMFTMTDRNEGERLAVTNLKVTTTSGSQNFDSCGIVNLESISERGDITIGKMKVEDNNEDTTKVTGNVKIVNKYGNITFKEGINIGGNCDIESATSTIKVNNVYGAFSYKGDSGYLTIKDVVGTVYLDSSNVACKINSINNASAELVLSNGNNASLDIGSINAATVVVKTKTGNININSLKTDTANFETTVGNITIGNLYSQIKATTTDGNITIKQGNLNECVLNGSNTLPIDVSTQKGTIALSNINAKLTAVASKSGSIQVEMVGILDDCVITSSANNIDVQLPTVRFNTITSSKSGSVDFNLLEHIYATNDYTFSRINNPESDVFETVEARDQAIQADRDAGVKFVTISSDSGDITVKAHVAA